MLSTRHPKTKSGFTLVEVLIAMSIFMMVMTAVYSTWIAIVRGSRAGLQAAANAQRARVAIRCLQEALVTAVNYSYPGELGEPYRFIATTSGDFAEVEFAAKLPSSFPGVSRYGGNTTRRVRFFVERGDGEKNQLVVEQSPLLLPKTKEDFRPFKLILSPDVTRFEMKFFDTQTSEIETEWKRTNNLPSLVQIWIGQDRTSRNDAPQDLSFTSISIPSANRQPGLRTRR